MVITLVQIPGEKRDVDAAITGGKASTPTYLGLDGLLMKYYLNGDQGGGAYLWASREKAGVVQRRLVAHDENRFGVRPLTISIPTSSSITKPRVRIGASLGESMQVAIEIPRGPGQSPAPGAGPLRALGVASAFAAEAW